VPPVNEILCPLYPQREGLNENKSKPATLIFYYRYPVDQGELSGSGIGAAGFAPRPSRWQGKSALHLGLYQLAEFLADLPE
jgi:hypothetical protein